MPSFEKQFMESKGEPISYKGTKLQLMDKITVDNVFSLSIKLLSTNSSWRQGIVIKTDGNLKITNTLNGKSIDGKEHILWEEGLRAIPISIKGYSKNGILFLWNVWNTGDGVVHAWHNGAAMKKEILEDKIIYYCNDGHPDDNFSDIIFSLNIKSRMNAVDELLGG